MSRYDESCAADAMEDQIATHYEERTGKNYARHKSNTFFLRAIRPQIRNERDYDRIVKAIRLQEDVENVEYLRADICDGYCKYIYDDSIDQADLKEICEKCPLGRLSFN